MTFVIPSINVEKCFEPHFHKAFSNVIPIVELWNIPVADCLSYCITNSVECHSVVYHKHFFTCQLYKNDNENNDNNFVFASGHDFFKRISFSNECQTISSGKEKSGSEISGKDNFKSKMYVNAFKSLPIQDKSDIIPVENHEMITQSTMKTITTTSVISHPSSEDDDTNVEQILFFNPPLSKYVLSEIKLGFFKVSDVNSFNINGKKIFDLTESQCLETCKNKNNIEEKKTFCQSVIYNKIKKSCMFLNGDSKEFGRLTRLVKDDGVVFYDKMALPVNVECKKIVPVFNVFMNKMSTENIIKKYPSIDKLKDCVTLCTINSSCSFVSYSLKVCSLHSMDDGNLNVKNGTNYGVVVENSCI
uniref:PAN domain protein n=1 Tax=Strongyloides venezuelensis TaxID=75913 RepID=A0A0K0F449_STRVS